VSDLQPIRRLLAGRSLDAELAALLWLLLEARIPLIVVGAPGGGRDAVVDGLAAFMPADARTVDVAPDDDFAWLPEAVELGWRHERAGPGERGRREAPERDEAAVEGDGSLDERLSSSTGVLIARGLADLDGIAGARARIVVRSLALGYGLIATMTGGGLDDALNALHDPAVGTDPDERSRLGVVLAVGDDAGTPRVTAAHYVRPVALDTHGHVQRQPPAILATWNAGGDRWEHFAWGVVPDLAGRLGIRPIELEREEVRRAGVLAERPRDG
jgi:hypothetical protein